MTKSKAKSKAKSSMDSDTWCSPVIVAEPLAQFFGGPVACDPCTNENSIIDAKRGLCAGGLHLPWAHDEDDEHTVYRNNPYSVTDPWVDKSIREQAIAHHRVDEEVFLTMVATSTKWWRKQCGVYPVLIAGTGIKGKDGKYKPGSGVELFAPRNPRLLFTGRLRFIGDVDSGARFDTVLGYYGSSAKRQRAFDKEFKSITKWSAWGR